MLDRFSIAISSLAWRSSISEGFEHVACQIQWEVHRARKQVEVAILERFVDTSLECEVERGEARLGKHVDLF